MFNLNGKSFQLFRKTNCQLIVRSAVKICFVVRPRKVIQDQRFVGISNIVKSSATAMALLAQEVANAAIRAVSGDVTTTIRRNAKLARDSPLAREKTLNAKTTAPKILFR